MAQAMSVRGACSVALAAVIGIMFSAALGIGAGAADASEGDQALSQRRGVVALHRNRGVQFGPKLEQGERVLTFLRENYGEDRAATYAGAIRRKIGGATAAQPTAAGAQPTAAGAQLTAAGAQPTAAGAQPTAAGAQPRNGKLPALPRGFWGRYIREELKLRPSKLKRMELHRALVTYIECSATGATTRAGLRQGRQARSNRNSGAAENRTLAPGLGFQLLQYFVDYIQNLQGRADSMILMTQARVMRDELLNSGTLAPSQLPKLADGAGKMWFKRWRQKYGIVWRKTGMKLKVSWRKVLRRVRVELGNVFRLRALWAKCHPGTPMRWLSLDQKPSWFNNAGATGTYTTRRGRNAPTVRENHNATRERYTIFTSVCSWWRTYEPPPPVCVLFRGQPGGRILDNCRANFDCPPWMMLQVQENGSYRAGDCVASLEWILPDAADSSQSIIVLLDWFSAHRADDVERVVQRKGHVLLFHGGGVTPWIQVNDTHLHASVARSMITLENAWAHSQRVHAHQAGLPQRTPSLTRADVCELVQAMWTALDHPKLAQKGYRQTGPELPMEGPWHAEDIFKDLLNVLRKLDPGAQPTDDTVSTRIRDEAIAFVDAEWEAGRLRDWSDARALIEEHDDEDEPVEEGLEAFTYDPSDNSGGDDDSPGDDDGDDGGGGAAHRAPPLPPPAGGAPSGAQPTPAPEAAGSGGTGAQPTAAAFAGGPGGTGAQTRPSNALLPGVVFGLRMAYVRTYMGPTGPRSRAPKFGPGAWAQCLLSTQIRTYVRSEASRHRARTARRRPQSTRRRRPANRRFLSRRGPANRRRS